MLILVFTRYVPPSEIMRSLRCEYFIHALLSLIEVQDWIHQQLYATFVTFLQIIYYLILSNCHFKVLYMYIKNKFNSNNVFLKIWCKSISRYFEIFYNCKYFNILLNLCLFIRRFVFCLQQQQQQAQQAQQQQQQQQQQVGSPGNGNVGKGSPSPGNSSSPGTVAASNKSQTEPKPVECNLCHRKFKNIPALNGHMRLHGGYFKKVNIW